jgi:glutamine synthetase
MSPSVASADVDFIERHGIWNHQQRSAAQAMQAEIASGALRNVRVTWADQHGIVRGKALTIPALEGALRRGLATNIGTLIGDSGGAIVFNPFTAGGGFGRDEMTGAPDVIAVPDPTTFRVLPWADRTGWVLCDLFFTTGEPVPYSTRGTLRAAIDAAAEMGLEIVMGIEMEWHLTRVDPAGAARTIGRMGAPGAATPVVPTGVGYQHQLEADLDALEGILIELQDGLEGVGLPLRSMESELGPSQLEFTFAPLPALEAADAALLFRTAVKQICARQGYHASFMSRPGVEGLFSSGWHLHVSARDSHTGANLFVPSDPDQYLSELGLQFSAGILEHARAATLFTTPTVTGYKRFRPNSLAPDRANWGRDQRGAMIRVCGSGGDPSTHIENRAGEPAANPYLYASSQILAGLDGVRRALVPPPPTEEPYETQAVPLPTSLAEAIAELDASAFFRGALGDEVVDFLLTHKRSELERFSSAEADAVAGADSEPAITGWEQREYFDLY